MSEAAHETQVRRSATFVAVACAVPIIGLVIALIYGVAMIGRAFRDCEAPGSRVGVVLLTAVAYCTVPLLFMQAGEAGLLGKRFSLEVYFLVVSLPHFLIVRWGIIRYHMLTKNA